MSCRDTVPDATVQPVPVAPPLPVDDTVPHFLVALTPPDLSPWLAGNIGIAGFHSFAAPRSGPHVLILALMHGNEIGGAMVIDGLLHAGFRPERGRLTLGLANFNAYRHFDPANPTASRFIDEDLNRVWDSATLEGPRHSLELDRAREMRPVIDSADIVFDLHSMLWPSDPLLLSGPGVRGRALALAIGTPGLVVADGGHAGGRRLIDYRRFTEPAGEAACALVEAGQHWQPETVGQMRESVAALLGHAGMSARPAPPAPPRFAEVTRIVTATFAFTRPYRGGEVVARRGTLIAWDGGTEIRTPHDDCLLVMPSLKTGRGHTAIRLARFV
jgi:predicted deacylase